MALFTGGKKLEKLTQDNEKLAREVAKIKQLNDKISRENSELRLEKGGLLLDIETIKSQLNTFMEKYVDVEELERRAAELKNEIECLQTVPIDNGQISIAYDEIPFHLRNEIEELEQTKIALAKEISTKEAYLEKLNKQFDLLEQSTIANNQAMSESPESDIAFLNAEQEALQETIIDLRRIKMQLEDEISSLQITKTNLSGSSHGIGEKTFESLISIPPDEEVIQLRLKVQESEMIIRDLQDRIVEELADKNLEISSLKSQIDQKNRKISSMGLDGIAIAPEEVTALPSYLIGDNSQPESNDLVVNSNEFEELINQKDSQIDSLRETIASLNLEIQSLNDDLKAIQKQSEILQMDDDFTEDELDELNNIQSEEVILPNDLDQSITDFNQIDETELMKQLQAELDEIKNLSEDFQEVKLENDNLSVRLNESELILVDTNKKIAELEDDNNRLNSEIEVLLEELENVKASSEAPQNSTNLPSSFDEKEKILSDYLEKREKLSSDISALRRDQERLSALAEAQQKEILALQAELADLDKDKSDTLLILQQSEEKKSLLTKEIENLKDLKDKLSSEINELNDNLGNLESTSKVLEQKQQKTEELVLDALKSFNTEVVSLREQQTKIRADILEKEKEKSQKESEIERRDLQLSELKSDIKIAEKDLLNIRQHISSLKDEKDSLNKNLFDLKDTEKRLNIIVQDLKKNRDNLKDENNELELKLNHLFNSFSKRHSELEQRRVDIEDNINLRLTELRKIEENINSYGSKTDLLKADIQLLEHQKNDLVYSLEKLKRIQKDALDDNTDL
jgi:chromosome segregation ATPase